MENIYIGLGYLGAAIGAGLAIIGAGLGIGKLSASVMEGSARQPETIKELRTNMIIAAALIEGVTFLALVICFLAIVRAPEINTDKVNDKVVVTDTR